MKGPVLAAQHQLGLGQRFTAVDDFVDQSGIQGVGTDHLAAAADKGPVFAEVVQPVGVGGEVFPQGVVSPSAGRRKPDPPGAELFQQIKKSGGRRLSLVSRLPSISEAMSLMGILGFLPFGHGFRCLRRGKGLLL